jgi:hypothetical protein
MKQRFLRRFYISLLTAPNLQGWLLNGAGKRK